MIELIESILKLLPLILALAGAFAFIYRVDHKTVTNRERINELSESLRERIRANEKDVATLKAQLDSLESEMIKDLTEIKVSLAEIKGALRIKNNA